MLARVDLTYGLTDAAFRVNYIRDAFCVLSRRVVARAISHSYLTVGVAEQSKRKVEFFGECPILLFCIEAYTKNLNILIAVLSDSITEPDTFSRSARCVRFRIEPQYDRAASEVAQFYLFSCVRPRSKIWRRVSYIQHMKPPSKRVRSHESRVGGQKKVWSHELRVAFRV